MPSTTATSLASLGTALVPGAHGLVGFTSRVPGTDQLLNALLWDRDVDPVQWQPHPTAFARLRARGVTVTVVNKRAFSGSGLTVAAHRGADYVGADKVGERIAAAVLSVRERPALTYLYDGDLDWTGHRYGVASSQWLQQLSMVDAEAEQLREALPDVDPADGGGRPRHGGLPARAAGGRRRPPRAARRRRPAGRRGALPPPVLPTAAPSTTWPRPGASSSGTGPRC